MTVSPLSQRMMIGHSPLAVQFSSFMWPFLAMVVLGWLVIIAGTGRGEEIMRETEKDSGSKLEQEQMKAVQWSEYQWRDQWGRRGRKRENNQIISGVQVEEESGKGRVQGSQVPLQWCNWRTMINEVKSIKLRFDYLIVNTRVGWMKRWKRYTRDCSDT